MQVLQGSLVALITPMLKNGDIDYVALERLIDWHIDMGTNGIVSVGTTGESATLDFEEHFNVISHTINYVKKRVPVIAGTGANSTKEAIYLTAKAKDAGADYALLVTPYYNKPNQNGLIKHYTELANEVDIPQILYNVPSRTACDLLPESVKLLSKHQNIIGIKEAVDDKQRIEELLEISRDKHDFYIYSGDDPTFCKSLRMGIDGVISVAANVIPNLIAAICKYSLNNDFEKAQQIDAKCKNLYKLLFIESNPIPVKWMLYRMKKVHDAIRSPLIALDETFHDEVLSELQRLKLL